MIFHVTLECEEDGWVVVECPALPGCVSQGRDEEEALRNIREAITAQLWAEDQKAARALASDGDRQTIVVAVQPAPMGRLNGISGKEAAKAFQRAGLGRHLGKQEATW